MIDPCCAVVPPPLGPLLMLWKEKPDILCGPEGNADLRVSRQPKLAARISGTALVPDDAGKADARRIDNRRREDMHPGRRRRAWSGTHSAPGK